MERLVILTITDMVISCEITLLIAPPQQHAESCAVGGGGGGGVGGVGGAEDAQMGAAEVQENVIIRQHTSAYVSIRQHTPAYVRVASTRSTDGRRRGAEECVRGYTMYLLY
jgi:hypothetical protein